MINIKQELSEEDKDSEWKMLYTNNSHVHYKLIQNRLLPDGVFLKPCPYELLEVLKPMYGVSELVPSVSLFENNNGLSTQVPMKHIYYVDNEDIIEWNKHLTYVELRYSTECWEMRRLQKVILNQIKGKIK